jgi:hypothetical protein
VCSSALASFAGGAGGGACRAGGFSGFAGLPQGLTGPAKIDLFMQARASGLKLTGPRLALLATLCALLYSTAKLFCKESRVMAELLCSPAAGL